MPDGGIGGGRPSFRVERDRFFLRWSFVARAGLTLGFFFALGAAAGASLCGLVLHFAGWLVAR